MDNEDEIIRQAMAALGRRTSPAKQAASRQNPKGKRSPEAKARMQAAQQARRAQEIEKGVRQPAPPKKPRGWPKGRPRKASQTEEAEGNDG